MKSYSSMILAYLILIVCIKINCGTIIYKDKSDNLLVVSNSDIWHSRSELRQEIVELA